MRRAMLLAAALAAAAFAGPARAADFATGSEAKEWGLFGEEKARFTAKVVDIACVLAEDCPSDCGGGTRQLGLLRSADGALVLAAKNGQPAFTGAVVDLLPYCGKEVEVDGLMVGEDERSPTRIYMVQMIREPGGEWSKTNLWTKDWNQRHPAEAKAEGPWFRKDPGVAKFIEKEGYLGLGKETDEAFIKDYF